MTVKNIVLVACMVTMYLTIDRSGLYTVVAIIAAITAAGLIVTGDNLGGKKI